jgi:Zn-dependent peptidase ImmA (M78 family)
VAAAVRGDLQVAFDEQLGWKSVSEAQRSWRSRLEDAGILVFFIPLGQASCRGFSVWDERAPLIAVNTAWNPEARIFTLFHELGHLLTRTDSACIDTWRQVVPEKGGDPAERWCEQFAAAVLLPWSDLEDFLERQIGWKRGNTIRDLATVGRIARKLKTSLRATTLRLIAHQVVPWELYRAIPAAVDSKKGGGGRGRDRSEIRRGQYGERTIHLFKEAIEREILSRDDVLSYLDVPDADL